MNSSDDNPVPCTLPCDSICFPADDCSLSLCVGSNIFVIIAFGVLLVPLLVRFAQMMYHVKQPRWTLKKIIFLCEIGACVTKILRAVFIMIALPIPLVIDRLLLWYSFVFMISAYSLLVLFWYNLCERNKTLVFTWLGTKTKRIFFFWVLILFLIFTALAIVEQAAEDEVGLNNFKNYLNILGAIIMVIVLIATLVEGIKLTRLLKSIPTTSRDPELLRIITALIVAITISLVGGFLTIVLSTIVRAVQPNFATCQSFQLAYRVFELFVIGSIGWNLRKYAVQSGRDSSSAKPDLNVEMEEPHKDISQDLSDKRESTTSLDGLVGTSTA